MAEQGQLCVTGVRTFGTNELLRLMMSLPLPSASSRFAHLRLVPQVEPPPGPAALHTLTPGAGSPVEPGRRGLMSLSRSGKNVVSSGLSRSSGEGVSGGFLPHGWTPSLSCLTRSHLRPPEVESEDVGVRICSRALRKRPRNSVCSCCTAAFTGCLLLFRHFFVP